MFYFAFSFVPYRYMTSCPDQLTLSVSFLQGKLSPQIEGTMLHSIMLYSFFKNDVFSPFMLLLGLNRKPACVDCRLHFHESRKRHCPTHFNLSYNRCFLLARLCSLCGLYSWVSSTYHLHTNTYTMFSAACL